MRKLLIGGTALLAAMLLNAEDTKVSSYTWTIDNQIAQSTDTTPEPKAKPSAQKLEDQQSDKIAEQKKWDKLTEAQKQAIRDERTAKRAEGIKLIDKRSEELDAQTKKLAAKKSEVMEKEKFEKDQTQINQKQGRLAEMRVQLEKSPVGQNVDLESAHMPRNEDTNNPRQH